VCEDIRGGDGWGRGVGPIVYDVSVVLGVCVLCGVRGD